MNRQAAFKFLTALTAAAVALIAVEIVLRVSPTRSATRTEIGELPGTWNQNLPSFRGDPPKRRKRKNTFRVVVLGDSYTWGSGVYPDDAYPRRLERRLSAVFDTYRAEVINWSRPGWNTSEQWRSFEPRLDVLDPDLVIVGFCLNDAEPTSRDERERFRAARGLQSIADGPREHHGIARWSVLVQRSVDALRNLRSRRILSNYYHDLYTDGDGWAEARETLAVMKQRLEARDTRLLVVVHPVFDSQLDHRYRYRDIHETVVRGVTDAGVEVLDLLPHYEGIDARRLALVPFTDAHPSELAHRISADAILQHLLIENWLGFDTAAWKAGRLLRRQRKIQRNAAR